jgi:pimeloyl-ACP methyl ester carboxylesterase
MPSSGSAANVISDGAAAPGPVARSGATGQPEREGVMRIGERRLAWSEWGPVDGRPVLLLEGMPGSSHACPDVETTHDLGVRLVAPDRPGYGESDALPGRTMLDSAADLEALLDELDVNRAPLVGWSSGVGFAIAAAHRLGTRIASLELVAGDPPFDELPGSARDPELAERVVQTRSDPAGARLAALERGAWFAERPESIVEQAFAPGEPGEDDPDGRVRQRADVREMLLEMFRHAGRHGAEGWVDDGIATLLPWGFSVTEVGHRATVWYGVGDRLSRRVDSEVLAELMPAAHLRVLPNEGHLLPIEHWREILEDALADQASF